MKKLPELYKNIISLNSHNKKYCIVEEKNNINTKTNVEEKIKSILNNSNYLNNISVIIKTKNKEYRTSIVAKVNNNILTINNDKIPLNEIVSIEELEKIDL